MKYMFFAHLATRYDEQFLHIFEVILMIASSAEKVKIVLPINIFLKFQKSNKVVCPSYLSWFRAPKKCHLVKTTIKQGNRLRFNINNFITKII